MSDDMLTERVQHHNFASTIDELNVLGELLVQEPEFAGATRHAIHLDHYISLANEEGDVRIWHHTVGKSTVTRLILKHNAPFRTILAVARVARQAGFAILGTYGYKQTANGIRRTKSMQYDRIVKQHMQDRARTIAKELKRKSKVFKIQDS